MKHFSFPGDEEFGLTDYEAGIEKESFCLYCDNLDLHLNPGQVQQETLSNDQLKKHQP